MAATTTPVWFGFCLLLCGVIGVAIFRLLLHPLSSCPGPLLARLTGLYEAYWDCVKDGQYAFHVQELHKRYGKPFHLLPCGGLQY